MPSGEGVGENERIVYQSIRKLVDEDYFKDITLRSPFRFWCVCESCEEMRHGLSRIIGSALEERNQKLAKENARLREALEEAREAILECDCCCGSAFDAIQAALEGEETT